MDKSIISNKIEQAIAQGIFPGAVVLCAVNQEVVFHEAYGRADIFQERKMEKDYIFDLASLTKPLATTLALSKFIDADMDFLNQKLGSIIEEFKNTDKADITIDMLLRHTSGLPAYREYYKNIKNSKNERRDLRQLLINEPLEQKPGENQVYSDLGFMILSWVIEKISLQRLDYYVAKQIYSPLEIEDLFFIELKSKVAMCKKYQNRIVATQQCPWRKKILIGEVDDDNAWAVGGIEGHAGLFGNVESIYKLCSEILNALLDKSAKILSHETIKILIQKRSNFDMVAGFDTPAKKNSSSGNFFSRSSIGHLGFTGTSFWIDPEKSLIIIFLTNRVHPLRNNEGIKAFRGQLHDLIYKQVI